MSSSSRDQLGAAWADECRQPEGASAFVIAARQSDPPEAAVDSEERTPSALAGGSDHNGVRITTGIGSRSVGPVALPQVDDDAFPIADLEVHLVHHRPHDEDASAMAVEETGGTGRVDRERFV